MDKKILVRDIMTKEVIFASPEEEISEVAEKLTKNRIHGLPVVENGKISGVITETDFFIKSEPGFHLPSYIDFLKNAEYSGSGDFEHREKIKKLINSKAKDIMTSPCVTVSPDAEISEVVELIKTRQFVTIPVVGEEGKLVGIIASADIIKLI